MAEAQRRDAAIPGGLDSPFIDREDEDALDRFRDAERQAVLDLLTPFESSESDDAAGQPEVDDWEAAAVDEPEPYFEVEEDDEEYEEEEVDDGGLIASEDDDQEGEGEEWYERDSYDLDEAPDESEELPAGAEPYQVSSLAEGPYAGDDAEGVEDEAEEAWSEPTFEYEVRSLVFPSGESLRVVDGPVGNKEEHYDPTNSGNPLLDTSGANRSRRLSRNFTVDEFVGASRRFDKARIDPNLVIALQKIRDYLNTSVVITSGYRSYGYNLEVYAKRNQKPTESQHSAGRAADIKVAGKTGMDLAKAAIDVLGGRIGVGIANTYAHVDVRGTWARWTYFRDPAVDARVKREIDAYRTDRMRRGAVSPGPTAPPVPSPASLPPAHPSAPGTALRQRIVAAAKAEVARWGGGNRKETDSAMHPVLREYWQNLGLSLAAADRKINGRSAWSAAFISWVMTRAGVGPSFKKAGAHYVYLAAAKKNRLSSDRSNPFWAFDRADAAPEVGDIVCKARKRPKSSQCSAVTYANVDNGTFWPTHGDIVIDVQPGKITVAGGNVNQSAKTKVIATDAQGHLPETARDGCRYIAVIKVRDSVGTVTPPPPAPAMPRTAPTASGNGASAAAATTYTPRVKVDDRKVQTVLQYQSLAEAAATKYSIDPALILGVIAAESGGKRDLVARSGYTGLMQAGKDPSHTDPAVSIDHGTKKLRDFRAIMQRVLKERGRRYDELPEAERLRLLALAYNAGPVTVAKALQYAAADGRPERWLDAEYYNRALLFTGAYSVSQAEPRCLKDASPSARESLRRDAERVRNQWRFAKKSRDWRKVADPPPWGIVSLSLPPVAVCTIAFKHARSPSYAGKILAYRERFRVR